MAKDNRQRSSARGCAPCNGAEALQAPSCAASPFIQAPHQARNHRWAGRCARLASPHRQLAASGSASEGKAPASAASQARSHSCGTACASAGRRVASAQRTLQSVRELSAHGGLPSSVPSAPASRASEANVAEGAPSAARRVSTAAAAAGEAACGVSDRTDSVLHARRREDFSDEASTAEHADTWREEAPAPIEQRRKRCMTGALSGGEEAAPPRPRQQASREARERSERTPRPGPPNAARPSLRFPVRLLRAASPSQGLEGTNGSKWGPSQRRL